MSGEDSDPPAHMECDHCLHWAHFGYLSMQTFFMRTLTTDAQADLSFHWVYTSKGMFSRVELHLQYLTKG